MSVISQITDSIRARMGRLLDRMEDPAETLALARRRQQEMLEDVRRRLDDLSARRVDLESEVGHGQILADQLAADATAAQAAGDDGTARGLFDERAAVLDRLAELGDEHRALADQEVRLVETENRLLDRMAEFSRLAETVRSEQATDSVRAAVDRAAAEARRMEAQYDHIETGA